MKFSEILKNIIFGNICPSCEEPMAITDTRNMCEKCDAMLRKHLHNKPIRINDINISADKFLFSYKYQDVRSVVLQMKRHPSHKACTYFAELAAECLKADDDFPDFDIITHCPRKPSKKRRIGYDHSQYFAQQLARLMDKPYIDLLCRREGGKEQKTLRNVFDRARNVQNKFYANPKNSCRRKRVLIVDDIVTTASTARECARVLKESGARKIMALFILD